MLNKVLLGKPVDPTAFMGRSNLVSEISKYARHGHNVDLFGPHQTGKTALCSFLKELFDKSGDIKCLYTNLQHFEAFRFYSMVNAIAGYDVASPPKRSGASDPESIAKLDMILKQHELPL